MSSSQQLVEGYSRSGLVALDNDHADELLKLGDESPPRRCLECGGRADYYLRDDSRRLVGDYCNDCLGGRYDVS